MKKLLLALGGVLLLSSPALAHRNGYSHHGHHSGSHKHCHNHYNRGYSHCHRHSHRPGNGHHGTQYMHGTLHHGHHGHHDDPGFQIIIR